MKRLRTILLGIPVIVVAALIFQPHDVALAQPAAISNVDFDQVDFFLDGSLEGGDTDWGEFNVDFTPGSDFEFVNVLANTGGSDEWVIRNLPLIPESFQSSGFSSQMYFDLGPLGVSSGTDISTLDYCITQATVPSGSAPVCIPNQVAQAGDSQAITNSGVPSGVTAVGAPPAADVFDFLNPFINVETNWHKDMPNVVQGTRECGPGAAANSLHWLAQEHGWALKNDDIQNTLSDLANNMGTGNIGTWDKAFAEGKLKFAKDNKNKGVDVTNHFAGGAGGTGPAGNQGLPTDGNYVSPNGNGTAVRDGPVTWDYVEQELDKGEDVEIVTKSHWVVLEGKISWGDVHLVAYRDDNFQNGGATTADEKASLAKRHQWTYMKEVGGKLRTNIAGGDEEVLTVFSESARSSVGGTTELLVHGSDASSAAGASGSEDDYVAPIVAAIAASGVLLALAGAGLFVRRRLVR